MTLNLINFIPETHRTKEVLSTLVAELDTLVEGWIDDIEGLADLLNPNTVPAEYMQYLADLLGIPLTSADVATESERRQELIQIVDWIKLKGTYQSLRVIGLMIGRKLELLDMYTNDYVIFELVDWFVGKSEGENPSGLDASYYKSPHFGVQTRLNVKYPATATWVNDYLWIPTMFQNLDDYIEKTRPINTVPHYYILLQPETRDDGLVMRVDGDIYTKIIGAWDFTKKHFDQDAAIGSGFGLNFDDGEYFDWSQDAFYQGITKWKIGIGSKGATPGDSSWTDLENIVLEGTIDSVDIYSNRAEYEFIISARTLYGISELGLYTPGSPDVLRIASTFPDINLDGDVDLRIRVIVYRTTG